MAAVSVERTAFRYGFKVAAYIVDIHVLLTSDLYVKMAVLKLIN